MKMEKKIIRNFSEGFIQDACSVPDDSTYNKFEPILPEKFIQYSPRQIQFSKDNVKWFQPTTMSTLLSLKDQYPSGKLIVGNTEVGIETKFKGLDYEVFINPSYIPELKMLNVEENGIRVGGSVTVSEFKSFISSLESSVSHEKLRGLSATNHTCLGLHLIKSETWQVWQVTLSLLHQYLI